MNNVWQNFALEVSFKRARFQDTLDDLHRDVVARSYEIYEATQELDNARKVLKLAVFLIKLNKK